MSTLTGCVAEYSASQEDRGSAETRMRPAERRALPDRTAGSTTERIERNHRHERGH